MERSDAIELAERVLDDEGRDPDDDLSMLSRQFLRALEMIERMAEERHLLHGSTADAFWSCSRPCCQQVSKFLRCVP